MVQTLCPDVKIAGTSWMFIPFDRSSRPLETQKTYGQEAGRNPWNPCQELPRIKGSRIVLPIGLNMSFFPDVSRRFCEDRRFRRWFRHCGLPRILIGSQLCQLLNLPQGDWRGTNQNRMEFFIQTNGQEFHGLSLKHMMFDDFSMGIHGS